MCEEGCTDNFDIVVELLVHVIFDIDDFEYDHNDNPVVLPATEPAFRFGRAGSNVVAADRRRVVNCG